MWQLAYTKQAQKDAQKLGSAGLKDKAQNGLKYCAKIRFKIRLPMKNW